MRSTLTLVAFFAGLAACSLANTPADPEGPSGEGASAATCSGANKKQCGSDCVDTSTDPEHCGGCSEACADGESCVEGVCGAACLEGHTPCGGICVDTKSDSKHCGGCDQACGDDEMCVEGKCDKDCPPGQNVCQGMCVDTGKDTSHCGGCEQPCANGELCIEGKCEKDCPEGQDVCLGMCVDTSSDVAHCGGCEQPCAATELCVQSKCVCPMGQDSCNGKCVDLASDLANCGMCSNTCPGAPNGQPICEKSMCGYKCDANFDNCNNKPADGCETNVTTDVLHCGGCGKPCAAIANGAPGCSNSMCGIGSCNKGYDDCDMKVSSGCEVNLTSDDNHCGQCNLPCPQTHYCSGSTCLLKPTCGNPNGGSLTKDNGTGQNKKYCYNANDSTQTRAQKACESHFGEGKCCIITGGYADQQYGECGQGGGSGTIHWHYDNHPGGGHCSPYYKVGDVVSKGWCGTILGNFM